MELQQIKQRFLHGVSQVVLGENPLSIVEERSDSIIVIPHFASDMPLTQAQRNTQALAERIHANGSARHAGDSQRRQELLEFLGFIARQIGVDLLQKRDAAVEASAASSRPSST